MPTPTHPTHRLRKALAALGAAGIATALGAGPAVACGGLVGENGTIELVRTIWVGFDLYRSEILKQMNEELPTTLEDERALWQRLTERLRAFEEPVTMARTDETMAHPTPP